MRLLLVEDDARMARFILKGLRERGYAVDLAADGEHALYQSEINPYDCIVLDWMIPQPDGIEVCRRLRHTGRSTPVLLLTARDAVEDRVLGLDAGADDYLVKPFQFDELVARIRALLRRAQAVQPVKLRVGDLTLDTARQQAARGGKTIPLTGKEYALLEFLGRNAGRIVTRQEISEHVWDESFDVFSNLIEVYVNRLRKKLDAGGARPLLHTRRGAGYMLSDE